MKHLYLLTLLFLTACSTGQENFSTEPGKGFGWKSMQENHARIQQELGGGVELTPTEPILLSSEKSEQREQVENGKTETSSSLQRRPEQTLRVWMAPYQDKAGDFHEESVIHTVVQSGQWVAEGI